MSSKIPPPKFEFEAEIEFEVAVDPNSQVKRKMKVLQMPTTILVDQSGEIIFRHQGYLPGDEHDICLLYTSDAADE